MDPFYQAEPYIGVSNHPYKALLWMDKFVCTQYYFEVIVVGTADTASDFIYPLSPEQESTIRRLGCRYMPLMITRIPQYGNIHLSLSQLYPNIEFVANSDNSIVGWISNDTLYDSNIVPHDLTLDHIRQITALGLKIGKPIRTTAPKLTIYTGESHHKDSGQAKLFWHSGGYVIEWKDISGGFTLTAIGHAETNTSPSVPLSDEQKEHVKYLDMTV